MHSCFRQHRHAPQRQMYSSASGKTMHHGIQTQPRKLSQRGGQTAQQHIRCPAGLHELHVGDGILHAPARRQATAELVDCDSRRRSAACGQHQVQCR